MQTATGKNKQFEYIRALCTVAVITIHTMNSGILLFGADAELVERVLCRIAVNLMWWAVPCFIMMTGSLLLDTGRKIDLRKLYGKYIARMLIVLFTFGLAFSWMELFFETRTIALSQIPQAFLNVLTGNTWAHMWYIYCLLGLYILLPLYKLVADHATDQQLKYILLCLFVFGAVLPLTQTAEVKLGFYIHINTIYPFWLLMGAAWNRGLFKRSIGFNAAVLAISTGLLIAASVLHEGCGILLGVLFGYDSVLVILQSVALFSLFNTIRCSGIMDRILCEIGDKSFGIYLLHMVFINFIYKVVEIDLFEAGIYTSVLLIAANLLVCYLAVCVMKRIPGLKKII